MLATDLWGLMLPLLRHSSQKHAFLERIGPLKFCNCFVALHYQEQQMYFKINKGNERLILVWGQKSPSNKIKVIRQGQVWMVWMYNSWISWHFLAFKLKKAGRPKKAKRTFFVKKRRRRRSCLATVEIESDSLLHLGFKLAVAATAAVAIFTEKNLFTVISLYRGVSASS